MNLTLCGPSAFRYHRVPPQYLGLCPPLSHLDHPGQWQSVKTHPLFASVLGLPIHKLVNSRDERGSRSTLKCHLFTGELPSGSVQETEFGFDVTSPLMTLFTLAPSLSEEHLIMAMYEMCGSFSVFQPNSELQASYNKAVSEHQINPAYGWRRTFSTNGAPSSLWQRPPLIDIAELRRFAQATEGLRGHKKFLKCARSVTGAAASPFEVEASMLLALPLARGGCGFKGLQNNVEIRLPKNARTISGGHRHRYADIYFEAEEERPPLDIECQGAQIHDSSDANLSDSDRSTALQSMGINVILLTHDQIYHPSNFEAVRELICEKLGVRCRSKTPTQQAAEKALREQLFIDWSTLGTD